MTDDDTPTGPTDTGEPGQKLSDFPDAPPFEPDLDLIGDMQRAENARRKDRRRA